MTGRAMAALALAAGAARAETVAIVGGRVVTLGGAGTLDPGTVVVRDGRIESVAPGRAAPPGAEVVEVAGRVVTPGLVAADTQLGLVEISLEDSTRDFAISEPEDDQNHAAFRVADAVNARSTLIPVQRIEGVTSAVAVPTGGLVAGQSVWLDLVDGDRDRMIARRSLAVHVALGAGGSSVAGGSRAWALTRLREMLDDARTYLANRAAYDRNQSRRLAGSRLDLEALAPVVRGETPLAVRADREADLLAAMDLAREQKLRLVIVGAAEGWRVADRLAAAKVPVLVDPTVNLPFDFDRLASRLDNAALLVRAGVTVVLAPGEFATHNARTLRQVAGIAVAHGLPHEAALRAVTRNVAVAFGTDGDYGTIEPGKVANLVVWSGDPLELSTRVERVLVQGEDLPLVSRQTELRERYREVPPP